MEYPPHSGFHPPGYPENPYPNGSWGLSGHELEYYNALERARQAGIPPGQFYDRVAQGAYGNGPAGTAEQAQRVAQQAEIESRMRMDQQRWAGAQTGGAPVQYVPAQVPRRVSAEEAALTEYREQSRSNGSMAGGSRTATSRPERTWVRPVGGVVMVISLVLMPATILHGEWVLTLLGFLVGFVMFHNRRFSGRRR